MSEYDPSSPHDEDDFDHNGQIVTELDLLDYHAKLCPDLELSPEDTAAELERSRERITASAQDYFNSPNKTAASRLHSARIIMQISYDKALTSILTHDQLTPAEKYEEQRYLFDQEEILRVNALNRIVGEEVFEYGGIFESEHFPSSEEDWLVLARINFETFAYYLLCDIDYLTITYGSSA